MLRHSVSAWFVLFGCLLPNPVNAQVPDRPEFSQHIEPILQTLCFDCHGEGADEGGVQFDAADSHKALLANRKLWGKVWDNILTGNMPPADMSQPTEAERQTLSRWIGQTVFRLDPKSPDPGRVTIRRLNREEYRYSVLDLLGVEFNVDEHFPADDTGYGFDTIADVLTVPPTLMDKYFDAAAQISESLLESAEGNSEASRLLFGETPLPKAKKLQFERARSIVTRLASRAYRQHVSDDTAGKLLSLARTEFEEGKLTVEELVCRAIEAMLVSPRFTYRAEFQPRPDDSQSVHLIDEFALASRLSYFLWSSLPDEELLTLANAGHLRAELDNQVQRLVNDSKSDRFVENFVGQWLMTRDVKALHKSRGLHQKIRNLRGDMQDETHQFFAHIMREDLPVVDLIAADYSFLNDDLAKLYEVPGVIGDQLRLVKFEPDSARGGVLTHASVLMVTSNPDRTSPVKRGMFVLDNLLGMPAPPAPPDVPALEDSQDDHEKLTFREQLARHRADPGCATCHDRMDPLGLGLENFDSIGRWRDEEEGLPIDSSSQLSSGESFSDIRELRAILVEKRRLFYRCLTRKLMTYALGRGIEYTDTPEIEAIVDGMIAEENQGRVQKQRARFSTMLMGIVESPQFQMRRGNGSTGSRTATSNQGQ